MIRPDKVHRGHSMRLTHRNPSLSTNGFTINPENSGKDQYDKERRENP